MKLSPKIPRMLDALTVLACVTVALAFASRAVGYCANPGGRASCPLGGDGAGRRLWLTAFNGNGATDDWRYFALAWEAARVAVTDFHQLPSWNPYHCGGVVLFQDPQSPFPGPLFLLTFLWLSAGAAMKSWVITHLVVGALGGRKLAMEIGANRPEQVLAASLVSACGFCAWHFGGGHVSFAPFLFLPWLLWAHRRALRDARWAVLVAALLALTVYEGGAYPLPLMAVALGLDSLARLGSRDDRRALWVSLPIVGVLFPMLAAARLVPVLAYMREHPRLMPLDDAMSVAEIFQLWLTRAHHWSFTGHPFVWNEYGSYIGPFPIIAMLVGVAVAIVKNDDRRRARRIDLAVFAGLVWCAMGNVPGFSLFGLLHELPVYRSLRVPARFLHPATVALSLLVVWALIAARQAAEELHLRPWLLRGLVALELVGAVGVPIDLCVIGSRTIQVGVDPPLPHTRASAEFYQDSGSDYHRVAANPVRGNGTTVCYVAIDWRAAPGIQEGHVPQLRVEPPQGSVVTQVRWTPNAVTFLATLKRPAVVVINQNYEAGWRTSVGRTGAYLVGTRTVWHPGPATITPEIGLLAVELPAGRHEVEVRHRPGGLTFGLLLSLLGAALAGLLAWRATPARVDALRGRLSRALTTRESQQPP